MITVFCCRNSAYQAARQLDLPAEVALIPLNCMGGLEDIHLLKTLEQGVKGILVLSCQEGNCMSLTGNTRCAQRVVYVQGILNELGLANNIEAHNITANMAQQLQTIVDDFIQRRCSDGRE